MHAYDLLQLATVITWHGPMLIQNGAELPPRAIEEYWTASKCRLDRWGQELRSIRELFDLKFGFDGPSWRSVSALCNEILTGEIVTRLWTAVVALHDRKHGSTDAEPIVRSVLLGHLEARHRVLNLILNYHGVGPHEAVVLNRLRHRCERWSDILLARLGNSNQLRDLAHDAERVDDFVSEWPLPQQAMLATERAAWFFGAFSAAFTKHPTLTGNQDLNQRIAQSIVAGFPPETFNELGLPQTAWEAELQAVQPDQPLNKKYQSLLQQTAPRSEQNAPASLDWWEQLFNPQTFRRPSWPGSQAWDSLN